MESYKKILTLFLIIIVIISLILAVFRLDLINLYDDNSKDSIDVSTNPLLWKIEGERPSYVYGSIHVGTEEILTLPDVVYNAINNVDVVYTEVKLDIETQMQYLSYYYLPSGQTLEEILPQDVENNLRSYLEGKNQSFEDYNSYKMWFIYSVLTQIENPDYFQIAGLDKYIWNMAVDKGKITNGIETYEEQLSILDDLTIEEQVRFLNDSLNEITSENGYSIEPLVDAYLDGDLEAIMELENQDYNESDPLHNKILTRTLTNRNYNMSQRISDLISNNPDTNYFFTVGAAHLYGGEGVLQLLENEGYTITKVHFTKCSSCGCDKDETRINNRCYISYDEQYSSLY